MIVGSLSVVKEQWRAYGKLLLSKTMLQAYKLLLFVVGISSASSFVPTLFSSRSSKSRFQATVAAASESKERSSGIDALFEDFASFLQEKQSEIISDIEGIDKSGQKFSNDRWGVFAEGADESLRSGGITRVIQKGDVVEKGACSLTLLRGGKLSAERAAAIQGRQQSQGASSIKEGDEYYAAALSMVLHTRSPMVPTFRSDVRIFMVEPSDGSGTMAWFGGGSDLTPYFLFDSDIVFFHEKLRDLCDEYEDAHEMIDYQKMKEECDKYFYLPARSEHRGVGGMFFDDLEATPETKEFVQAVTDNWMPSWFPIIEKRGDLEYTEKQREWQLLRRGRYLEFNLLYDRGVKFGLANANPRVEGVMVSAPPLIAWEYNHVVEEGSEEDRLMKILKEPTDWI